MRFRREATILRRLAHPGVVTIFDAAEDPDTGAMYLVMERLSGQTLEATGAPVEVRQGRRPHVGTRQPGRRREPLQ